MANENLFANFGKEVDSQIAAAKRIKPSSQLGHRLDLRGKTVFTVTETAADIAESAFSINRTDFGWQLGVHIADVAEYVCEDSPLDLEARRRFASVETEKGFSPMLPYAIQELCGFKCGEDKLAVSLLLDIDFNGNAVSVKFDESVVRVSANCIFKEIDRIAEASDKSSMILLREKYSALNECIMNIYELAALFCAKRRANGGLDCTVFRRVYEKDASGETVGFRRESEPDSRAMIREIGYYTSMVVGKFMIEHKLPCMFIGQGTLPANMIDYLYKLTACESKETDPARLVADIADSAKGKEIYGFVCDLISAGLPCSVFSGEPIINASCGYDTLISFVRPLHKYSDILTQRIVKEMIAAEVKPSNLNINRYLKYVDRAAADASRSEKHAFDCRRANNYRLATEYILKSETSEFNAYPAVTDESGTVILFMECGLSAIIPSEYKDGREFAVGTPIKVEVIALGTEEEPIVVKPI